jgi:hypothetical protein
MLLICARSAGVKVFAADLAGIEALAYGPGENDAVLPEPLLLGLTPTAPVAGREPMI